MRLEEILSNGEPSLPNGYLPYPRITFCSNSFVDGLIPIAAGDEYLILVGQGPAPLVWLKQLVSGTGTLQFRQAVVANRPHPLFKELRVRADPGQKKTIVKVASVTILEAHQSSTDQAEVTRLDLRPLGILVHGNSGGLTVGTNDFSHNTFSNAKIMLALDRPSDESDRKGTSSNGGGRIDNI